MLTREEIRVVYDQGPEAIMALVERLCARIDQQQAQIVELRARVKALEDQLATNSRNSSKPPSSDSFTKQTRSLRQPSGRKSGGQPGHRGTTLQQVAVPDQTRLHEPEQCVACGASLAEVAGQLDPERRQVFDLPPLKLEVTEHRVLLKACAVCGHRNRGTFPDGVACGASYGPGVKGVLTYLNQAHLLPSARSCEIVADLFGQPVSEGVLEAAVNGCTTALAETETSIKQGLARAEVVHFDETGMYVEGKRIWLHSASTPQLTHYACHDHRGVTATQAIGILPAFGGRAIHDGFSSYWQYDCAHGLCNAHHLRELLFAHEQMNKTWAEQMKALLVEIKQAVDTAKAQQQTALAPTQLADYEQRYGALLQAGLEEEPHDLPPPTGQRGRKKQSKSKNLLDRLVKYQAETLAFMKDFAVPFDNNLAERDLRMMKVKQKVSGSFRTMTGAQAFCRIRSYISTMKKQGHNVIAALQHVFLGTPLVPEVPG
jgi:transposase